MLLNRYLSARNHDDLISILVFVKQRTDSEKADLALNNQWRYRSLSSEISEQSESFNDSRIADEIYALFCFAWMILHQFHQHHRACASVTEARFLWFRLIHIEKTIMKDSYLISSLWKLPAALDSPDDKRR
jgi:hypothetical protein